MNYTETQRRLFDELANEFKKINDQFDAAKGKGKLFNPVPVIEKELEIVRQIRELDAHNNAMYKQMREMYESLLQKLNDDIISSETGDIKIPMRCFAVRNIHTRNIARLEIAPIDVNGNQIINSDSLNIYIEGDSSYVLVGGSRRWKVNGFKYGCTDNYFKTIEEYVNSDYFNKRFGEIFGKYCVK